jgi:LuxR family transcriptional regulator, maltose regulon positive regulatory protein
VRNGRDPIAARAAVAADLAVPISDRELDVLALPPSLLTAREIAAEYTLSVNTVTSHVRGIYAEHGHASAAAVNGRLRRTPSRLLPRRRRSPMRRRGS